MAVTHFQVVSPPGVPLKIRALSVALVLWAVAASCGDGPDPAPTVPALPTDAPIPNVGDCLKQDAVEIAGVVPCDSAAAFFRVVAIDRGTGERVCPPETDAGTSWVGAPVSLCLKKLR
jgi:hypothetical protein